MSVRKNITINPSAICRKEDTIDVEYDNHHWFRKSIIVSLIKNINKIVWMYNIVDNILILDYNDGIENFNMILDKKILESDSQVSTIEQSNSKVSTTKQSIDSTFNPCNGNKIPDDYTLLYELEKKIMSTNKIIDDHQKIIRDNQKIIDEHRNEITRLNKEIIESKDQVENFLNSIKYKCGIKLTSSDKLKLLSKGIINWESFMADSAASNIIELFDYNGDEFRKLIIDKKNNINAKNKDGQTLWDISLKVQYYSLALFLLDNDINISSSVENDVRNLANGYQKMSKAYFDNAKRNNHIDFLVKHYDNIQCSHLKSLVSEHVNSKK
jgi:hypothetical protein